MNDLVRARKPSRLDFKRKVESLSAQMVDRSKIIPIDFALTVISEGAHHVPDSIYILKSPKLFQTNDEIRPDYSFLIFQYLSFSIRDGVLVRFASTHAAYDAFDEIRDLPHEFDTPFLTVHLVTEERSSTQRAIVNSIAQLMELYIHFYEYPQLLGRSASRYEKLLSARSPTPESFFDILSNIVTDYGISIAYTTYDSDNLSIIYGYCDQELLESPSFLNRFRYATSRNQTANCFIRLSRRDLFYTMIPYVQRASETHVPTGCVVLFNENDPITEQAVSFVSYFASRSYYEHARSERSKITEVLNDTRRSFLNKIRAKEFQTYSSRNQILRDELRDWCKSLALALGAHSVTIRLFDCFSRTLNVFVSYDETFEGGSEDRLKIPANDYRVSLNAAVFRLRAPSNPVRIDDVKDLLLPADLRTVAFSGPLTVRENTASEICASIWDVNTAIGTINLESPDKRRFRNDDLFIGSIARHLGELFSVTNEALSPPTIMQLARASDAAHGAAGIELDSILQTLSEEAKSIIPPTLLQSVHKFEEFRKDYRRDFVSDSIAGPSTIGTLINQIQLVYDKNLVPSVSEENSERFSIQYTESQVAPPFARSILRLVEIIFENAAKHSRIDLDIIEITVGPNEFWPGRNTFELRYRSTHSPVEPRILDSFGLAPIRKDGAIRYGAFLLGYQTRALGGMLEVRRQESGSSSQPLEFRISIPLQ